MKTLGILVLLSSISYADQAADAFGTGFANALSAAIAARQGYQAPIYQPPQAIVQPVAQAPQPLKNEPHYDILETWGPVGYWFGDYRSCRQSAGQNRDCVLIK